ncbi:MAG TPA: hypothetical protein VLG28_06670, partial [Acidimicrobiia bacterium]|nr:hypothetical protein [Acidimicrobiia bacterium]
AVPMSYHFGDGTFWMVTSPESLHGRLMVRRGRATMTVQFERCDGRSVSSVRAVANGVLSSLNATRSTTSVWSWRG